VNEKKTDFGYQRVPFAEKTRRVDAVFTSVARRYDLMNDLMSFGLHRIWKRIAVETGAVRAGARILDVAGGTGDLARLWRARSGPAGQVVVADINAAMLERGRRRSVDAGIAAGFACVRADARQLPFPDASFDCVSIAFGLRNVAHKERALAAMLRVLRPGGQVLVLEFSTLRIAALRPLYDAYSFRVLPWLGRIVARDAQSYRYLAESIRMHPDQEALKDMMERVGFGRCAYFNLAGGVIALHRGYRL